MRARCKARFVTSTPSPNHGQSHSQKPVPASPIQPSFRAFQSFFESKFKATKTPSSHGFSGFVAIKLVAESGEGLRGAAGSGKPAHGQIATALLRPEIRSEMDCGRIAKLGSDRTVPAQFKPAQLNRSPRPFPASSIQPSFRALHSFFESEFKAPTTPPSHGFRGLAAIKAVAESGEGCGARLAAGNQPTGRLRRVCCSLESVQKWLAGAMQSPLHYVQTPPPPQPQPQPQPQPKARPDQPNQAQPSRLSLLFQEQIQGPKNAPIARF